jgi:hypothetical protein
MTVYKNINFVKRDYECTNIVACKLEPDAFAREPKVPEGYEPADPAILNGLTPLWLTAGVRFYGYL